MIEQIEQGKIVTLENDMDITHLEWNEHPSCEGVFLKHIVTGELTDGKFSCHLVKVRTGCEISEHIHQQNWELHEVITGEATGYLADKSIPYVVGTTTVIPEGQKHKVVAGEQDLYLLAKFIPALI
jgi:mannose-6-phosphate isomerase-like protein (cupin superfamily)